METMKIKLDKYRGGPKSTIFSGRPQGEQTRKELKLDDLDKKSDTKVLIQIPIGTTSINPSFYLGLFYESIKRLGNKFDNKYEIVFEENEDTELRDIIEQNIIESKRFAFNSIKNRHFSIFKE
jgi:hypothetical protein